MASSSESGNLATAKAVLSTAASVAATAMLARSIANDFLPYELHDSLSSAIRSFFGRFSSQTTMVIDEFDGLTGNELYFAAEIYLGGKVSPSTRRLKVSKPEKEKSFSVTVERDEPISEVFNGAKVKWMLVCKSVESKSGFYNPHDMNATIRSESRSFELSFHKRHLDMIMREYLPKIVAEAKTAKQEKRSLKIFTIDAENLYNIAEAWVPTNLDHPATFETLALDHETKSFILADLEKFVSRKDYYRKVGKAWKRGYLLYGPPGTGKSSLIAAMANYLNFDIYDLELTELRTNSDLRKLLIAMANRSILVIEDIDCSVDFDDRNKAPDHEIHDFHGRGRNQLTLSGLLNFIDGLWSSCGDERIIIFTTNHKEKLDPALLRPGRMDVHVHMSYCTPCGFRILASKYLGDVKDNAMFEEIERQIESTEVTPAEVAEELMKSNDGDTDTALRGLSEFLKVKKKENEEAKVKKDKEEKEKAEKEKADKEKAEAEAKAKANGDGKGGKDLSVNGKQDDTATKSEKNAVTN